jgi:hypothetical protein
MCVSDRVLKESIILNVLFLLGGDKICVESRLRLCVPHETHQFVDFVLFLFYTYPLDPYHCHVRNLLQQINFSTLMAQIALCVSKVMKMFCGKLNIFRDISNSFFSSTLRFRHALIHALYVWKRLGSLTLQLLSNQRWLWRKRRRYSSFLWYNWSWVKLTEAIKNFCSTDFILPSPTDAYCKKHNLNNETLKIVTIHVFVPINLSPINTSHRLMFHRNVHTNDTRI